MDTDTGSITSSGSDESGAFTIEGHCDLASAEKDERGDAIFTFERKQNDGRIFYHKGKMNSYQNEMMGHYGSTKDANEGIFLITMDHKRNAEIKIRM